MEDTIWKSVNCSTKWHQNYGYTAILCDSVSVESWKKFEVFFVADLGPALQAWTGWSVFTRVRSCMRHNHVNIDLPEVFVYSLIPKRAVAALMSQ